VQVNGCCLLAIVEVSDDRLRVLLDDICRSWNGSIIADEMCRSQIGVNLFCERLNGRSVELYWPPFDVFCAVRLSENEIAMLESGEHTNQVWQLQEWVKGIGTCSCTSDSQQIGRILSNSSAGVVRKLGKRQRPMPEG
jgi:hypothetical protein